MSYIPTQDEARALAYCPVCNAPKQATTLDQVGQIVCWDCFKRRTPTGARPLKYTDLRWAVWLMAARANRDGDTPDGEAEPWERAPSRWLRQSGGLDPLY